MNKNEKQARDLFQERIQTGLLGPGSDTWGLDPSFEIISDYPLIRYYTGILFPQTKESRPVPEEVDPEEAAEQERADKEFARKFSEAVERKLEKEAQSDGDKPLTRLMESIDTSAVTPNNFFPNNMALSVCIDPSVDKIDVEFSFGLYREISIIQRKIAIDEEGFHSFFDEQIEFKPDFLHKLKFNDGFMSFTKDLNGWMGGKDKPRSGDFTDYDQYIKRNNLEGHNALQFVARLKTLMGRAWQRTDVKVPLTLPVESTKKMQHIELPESVNKETNVGYHTKVYEHKGLKYVKILLVNDSERHDADRFSNKSRSLNQKCLFQAKITVRSDELQPLPAHVEKIPFDPEAERLNFLYREVKSYGIAHNCSLTWRRGNGKTEVETTFIPETPVIEIDNNLADIKDERFIQVRNIKNLSVFGKSQADVINDMDYFVSFYEKWIEQQEKSAKELTDQKTIADSIIANQRENLSRMKHNIELLKENDVFKAFQLMNLAMFMQIIISNDQDFSKKEKELSEIRDTSIYNDLDFFKNYDCENRIGFDPAYRPFQLAFILLSLDSIVDPHSKARKDIVDLIWFPTGGGKTEAYLAVTAFAIIWRRLINADTYSGTTVIMRYTLRLLTAQQFERASRLISVLEFLRTRDQFNDILRNKPITIGQWVGMSSTPNTVKQASKQVGYIEDECSKQKGFPQEKNVFQVSSCPWCGTKLITRKDDQWFYGFKGGKLEFRIHCVNEKCPFHDELPVQVVDEMLYRDPPTLLFGTVDKFAMLAWKPESHAFFNTHDKTKLPPDLIIQDELHLLNGPLGSICGLYEGVIELLCLRDGAGPKIISATATTRNTEEQVKRLYGSRKVNIFPPQGLTYEDSFFAKVKAGKTKRTYVGFMPTGKTIIDTQLHLLAYMLVTRAQIYDRFADGGAFNVIDNYWTIVSYFNSLKDVGRIANKIGVEILDLTEQFQKMLIGDKKLEFNYLGFRKRTRELTRREPSSRIKSTLNELTEPFTKNKIVEADGYTYLNNIVDLLLATNMISVGIDVGRLNVMLINGMPRNVAEYIQASSRIGRNTYGLVLTLLNANQAREKSYFEHFISFHRSFYKFVEPLSVTPFTEMTLEKALTSILVTYIRQYYHDELGSDNQAGSFTPDRIDHLMNYLKKRYADRKDMFSFFESKLMGSAQDWQDKVIKHGYKKYSELLVRPADQDELNRNWVVMQSMREIDTSTFVQIKEEE
jgi:hypothetical protein